MPIAYVSPFINATNRYTELHKQLLREIGYTVQPLSLRPLLLGGWRGLTDPGNLVTIHWLETRPFAHAGAMQKLSLKGIGEFLLYIFILSLARAKICYFVHDHAVHDTYGWRRSISSTLVKFLGRVADVRVVHDPASASQYDASYLPHPLYWDTPVLSEAPARDTFTKTHNPENSTVGLRFGLLGAIRPYKRIHTLLQHWPKNLSLTIKGRSTKQYAQELTEIIEARKLSKSVKLIPGFLSDEEFSDAIASLDVLILPHADDSMLVSGAFFEAAGRVPCIVARSSNFIGWVAGCLPQVKVFETDEQLALLAAKISIGPEELGSADPAAALTLFGWKACLESYGKLLCSTSERIASQDSDPSRAE